MTPAQLPSYLALTASTGKIPLIAERSCRVSLSMGNHVNLLTRFINTCKGISCSRQGCYLIILHKFLDSRCFLLTQLWSQQILL